MNLPFSARMPGSQVTRAVSCGGARRSPTGPPQRVVSVAGLGSSSSTATVPAPAVSDLAARWFGLPGTSNAGGAGNMTPVRNSGSHVALPQSARPLNTGVIDGHPQMQPVALSPKAPVPRCMSPTRPIPRCISPVAPPRDALPGAGAQSPLKPIHAPCRLPERFRREIQGWARMLRMNCRSSSSFPSQRRRQRLRVHGVRSPAGQRRLE